MGGGSGPGTGCSANPVNLWDCGHHSIAKVQQEGLMTLVFMIQQGRLMMMLMQEACIRLLLATFPSQNCHPAIGLTDEVRLVPEQHLPSQGAAARHLSQSCYVPRRVAQNVGKDAIKIGMAIGGSNGVQGNRLGDTWQACLAPRSCRHFMRRAERCCLHRTSHP